MLTEEQAGTIEDVDENKMIVALAGSGKTHTFISLVNRILMQNPVSTIAMVTFTNAATSEMEDRVKKMVGNMSNRVMIGTFARLMRGQFVPLIKRRRLLIGGESYGFVKRAMSSVGVDLDQLNEYMSAIDTKGRDLDFFNDGSAYSQVFVEYSELLKRYGRYDLNLMARELINGVNEGVIPPIKQDYILVDEFQDTDSLQYAWLKANSFGKKVAVVGDDDQSIYSWRGGRGYEAFVDFQNDFEAQAYLLSSCFRCSPEVLSKAKTFIEHNIDRIDKDMSTPKPLGGSVSMRMIPTGYTSEYTKKKSERDDIEISSTTTTASPQLESCRYIASELKGKEAAGWCVLARTNLQLDELEQAMSELDIKLVRIGGKSIFDNEHAFGISALLQGIVSAKGNNQLSTGLGWLGEKEEVLHQIFTSSKGMGFSAVSVGGGSSWLSVTIDMQEFAIEAQRVSGDSNIQAFISRFHTRIARHIKKKNDSDNQFQCAILDIFIRILISGKGSLEERVLRLASKLQKPNIKPNHRQSNAVVLTTFNSSKGLEWPNVWLMGLNEGSVPLLKEDDSIEKVEEERRLVYVGMTRAEDNLVISYNEKTPSPFVEEIIGYEP